MTPQTLRILVVEDDEADAEFAQRSLARCRSPEFHISTVESLAVALAAAKQEPFDAVLLDLALPDSLGLASLQEFALGFPQMPIIVLTGHEDDERALEAFRHGAQDYLYKGCSAELLRRSICYAIERKAFEMRVGELAYFDALTGLPNRRLFEQRLRRALARAKRAGSQVAVIFMDLDGFKAVNDSLGHEAGDQVLKFVADKLRGAVRDTESIARLGGDEFTVLLEGGEQAALAAAARILSRLQEPIALPAGKAEVTSSIGIALHPEHAGDGAALLRHADTAMFQAKTAGKNGIRVYRG